MRGLPPPHGGSGRGPARRGLGGGNTVTLYACPAHAPTVAPGPFGDEFDPVTGRPEEEG
ncbi:hypothetical protein [Streptomyces sp. NPDC002490]|uniref:hypothetical protein n=1 Tax=Streptomyces sp. NPDC002490 TaxID=3154416 RepID=UPI0033206C13